MTARTKAEQEGREERGAIDGNSDPVSRLWIRLPLGHGVPSPSLPALPALPVQPLRHPALRVSTLHHFGT